jgi:RNA polymerase sigma factor (sigma-70 family)
MFRKNITTFKVISKLIRLPVYMDELIALPVAHQQQSIRHAVQNYGKRLFGFIRSRVKNDEDAKDILQDVWFQLSSMIETEPIGQLGAWLFRVSRNRITDKNRKQTTLSLDDMVFEDEDGELIFQEALFADDMMAETEFDRAYFRETLFKALDELPDKQREVFVLNELEDMTLQQIADRTGESIKTIISRKRYAVAHLRDRLQEFYY